MTDAGAYANLETARVLADAGLEPRDAAFVTELVAGTCRLSGTYDRVLAAASGRDSFDPALADALRLVRMPYHLSSPTQAVARAALAHADTLLGTVEAIKAQRDRIVAETRALGLEPVDSDANFVLVGGFARPQRTWQALLDAGVLVRDVGITGHLRVTAGTPAETDAFLAALGAHLRGEALMRRRRGMRDQALGVAERGDGDVDRLAAAVARREHGRHHHGRHVLQLQLGAGRQVDALLLQHRAD